MPKYKNIGMEPNMGFRILPQSKQYELTLPFHSFNHKIISKDDQLSFLFMPCISLKLKHYKLKRNTNSINNLFFLRINSNFHQYDI